MKAGVPGISEESVAGVAVISSEAAMVKAFALPVDKEEEEEEEEEEEVLGAVAMLE